MKSDIEIAEAIVPQKIKDVAKKLGIDEDKLFCYGNYIAKVKAVKSEKQGKLVLVTAINPTPQGEGKTTVAIGLADGLALLGEKVALALREPSLGPVFGVKGGAAGGGYSQVYPMAEINLHFTGDIHAITAANNLLAAMVDNHIFQGNALAIDPNNIVFKRCLDANDRALRNITVNAGNKSSEHEASFVITAASEVMAIFCLATSLEDLKKRLGNILVAYTYDGRPVYARQLQAEEAMCILLKDAFNPNLVQTLEGTPAFIHGGPFANVAHGCNSIQATYTALSYADIVVTEAGFGADLGAEKFFDIKCRNAEINPSAVVLVASIRALKLNGGMDSGCLNEESEEYLMNGCQNLVGHVENLKKFGVPIVISLNRFPTDTENEINMIAKLADIMGVKFAVSESFLKGGEGAVELAKAVKETIAENHDAKLQYIYDLDDDIKDKITKLAVNYYGAESVEFSQQALKRLKQVEKLVKGLPICVAKTQYSFSDDPTLLGRPTDFTFHVSDIEYRAGAGFVVVLSNSMLLMFGLPKVPNACKMSIDENEKIKGLY
ncbi:MAG: formate--tetrahydrofolate ligase [Christensenellales bacterium]